MKTACTREEIRELDRRAIEDYGIPGLLLMENAGRGAAHVALHALDAPWGASAVIFCGKGNNGGDGFVVARHLHNAGARVHVVLACPPGEIAPDSDAGVNFQIVRRMKLPVVVADGPIGQEDAAVLARQADLIVDALLGTGLTGDVRDPYLSLIRLINAADKPVLAIDIPSGLDSNTGQILRAAVRARATATFVLPKAGFELADGPTHVGEVTVVDIGAPRELVAQIVGP